MPADAVLVLGGNGKAGQAAIQLATMAGVRVLAVEWILEAYGGHASGPVEMIVADTIYIGPHWVLDSFVAWDGYARL